MKKTMIVLMAGLLLMMMAPALGAPAVAAALLTGGAGRAISSGPNPALDAIPPLLLVTYQAAATVCPGLSWTVLAAIGTVESDNDQSTLPGVHSDHNPAGAEVIYGSDLGLRYVRQGTQGHRALEVSDSWKARGDGIGRLIVSSDDARAGTAGSLTAGRVGDATGYGGGPTRNRR